MSGDPRCHWHGVGFVESDDGWACPMCPRPPDVDQLRADLAAERAEVERLRAEHTFVERLVAGQLSSRMTELEAELAAERALADQLADAFGQALCGDDGAIDFAIDALDVWQEARRER